jgi:hypothetical protein
MMFGIVKEDLGGVEDSLAAEGDGEAVLGDG